ncbi:MAG: HEAT repeat domain-containing protein [Planctomycetota bacterium]|nr:HEAT repeat domain-containing protein [Planctomycetota bacterium]
MKLEVVETAARKLAETASPLALPYLWQLYDLGDGGRRKAALEALGALGVKAAQERLFEVSLADPLLSMRRLAAESLGRLLGRDEATRHYVNALKPDARALNPIGRFRCVQLIAHLGGKDAAPALRALLDDPDDDVSVAAIEGLATLGDLESVPLLVGRLRTERLELRPAIPDTLEHLTGEKNRYNLVKWEEWIEAHKGGDLQIESRAHKNPDGKPGAEDSYEPDYRDPYAQPVQESSIDFLVVFDTTGSLLHIWPEVSAAIDAVLEQMAKQTPSLRMGSVRYRADAAARTLTYQIKPFALSRNLQKARDDILDATFGGGSGGLHLGIRHAVSAMAWRANARKVVLVVGDTTPRDDGLQQCLLTVKEAWEFDRVQFNALYIRSLHGAEHKPTYRILAEVGGGRFYEYNKAWSRIVDLGVEKPDPKSQELPQETLAKWLTPPSREKLLAPPPQK